MAESFPNVIKKINLHTQEAKQDSKQDKSKETERQTHHS